MCTDKAHRPFLIIMIKANYTRTEKILLAKDMENNPTPAEKKLYKTLDKLGIRFLKQHIICGYIVDAYLPDNKIAIECDGGYHLKTSQKIYDSERDDILKKNGIQVIRFGNSRILNNPEGAINSIKGKFGITVKRRKKPKIKNKKPVSTTSKIPKQELKRIYAMNRRAKLHSSKLDSLGKKSIKVRLCSA